MTNANILLAIDFDNTIAYDAWPEIGKPKPNVSAFFHMLKAEGYHIIIWTCRHGDHVPQVKQWLKDHDIPYDCFNEHHPTVIELYGNDTRKISADIYIDDRNLGGLPEDWFDIYQLIKRHSRELCKIKHFDQYESARTTKALQPTQRGDN